jgi:hypothetical protein
MDKEPDLVDLGMGAYYEKGMSPEEKKEAYEHQRELLLSQVEEFNAACKWLRMQYKIKNVNDGLSSYSLKKYAQAWDKEVDGGGNENGRFSGEQWKIQTWRVNI